MGNKSNHSKLPDDASTLTALGTKRPAKTGYAPFVPFEMLWVVTNGQVQRNLLWVTVRPSGIYVASGGLVPLHTSYHSDGRFHWKWRRQKIQVETKPPLQDLPRPVLIQSGAQSITDEALERFKLTKFRDQPVDSVIYLDNRVLTEGVPYISYNVWAVPPFRHGDVPLLTEWPAQIHLVTHTKPWIEVVIYEQGREGRRSDRAVSIEAEPPPTSQD
jgi:hypothetical protein